VDAKPGLAEFPVCKAWKRVLSSSADVPTNPQKRSKKMKAVYVAMMAAAGVVMAGQAQADEALAKAKNCMSCHAIDKKLVGPAYKEVAAKYKGDAKAPAMLAAKVKAGGKGTWGQIPMPPNNVTEDEAKKLVAWVLSQK
jgi:cytochrome c